MGSPSGPKTLRETASLVLKRLSGRWEKVGIVFRVRCKKGNICSAENPSDNRVDHECFCRGMRHGARSTAARHARRAEWIRDLHSAVERYRAEEAVVGFQTIF